MKRVKPGYSELLADGLLAKEADGALWLAHSNGDTLKLSVASCEMLGITTALEEVEEPAAMLFREVMELQDSVNVNAWGALTPEYQNRWRRAATRLGLKLETGR
jgi:hypothetical protein